ncbi:MAG: signal peptidase II [Schwartzia sp.]|nr:signal peptidase II [Schwartzia sp. (in: firmicutes)]MBR1885972.1 signal peptidase II [Schwartzia sp. (in: firmicutes)]
MSRVFDLPPLVISSLLVAADQAVKFFVVSSMRLGESIPVMAGIFHVTYIENPGAAFGMFANQRWAFIVAGVAVILAAVAMYRRLIRESAMVRWGAALLLGGAAGNLIDRVRLGRVIDFLDFRVWPVFNIADIGICVGVACLIYALTRDGEKEKA